MTISYMVQYTQTIKNIEIQIRQEEQKKYSDVTWMTFYQTQAHLDTLNFFQLSSNRCPTSIRQNLEGSKISKQRNKLQNIMNSSFFPGFFKKVSGYSKQYDMNKRAKLLGGRSVSAHGESCLEPLPIQSLQKVLDNLTQKLNDTAIAKQIKLLEEQKKMIQFQSNVLLQRLTKVKTVAAEESLKQALINFLKTHKEEDRVQLNKQLPKKNQAQLARTLGFFQTKSPHHPDGIESILKDTKALFPEVLELDVEKVHRSSQLNLYYNN